MKWGVQKMSLSLRGVFVPLGGYPGMQQLIRLEILEGRDTGNAKNESGPSGS